MLIPTNHRAYNSVRHFIFGQMLTKRRNNFNATLNTKKKAYFEHLPHFKKKQPAYFANTERRIFTHFQHLGPDQMNNVVMSKDWHQVFEKLESSKSHIFNVKSKRRKKKKEMRLELSRLTASASTRLSSSPLSPRRSQINVKMPSSSSFVFNISDIFTNDSWAET